MGQSKGGCWVPAHWGAVLASGVYCRAGTGCSTWGCSSPTAYVLQYVPCLPRSNVDPVEFHCINHCQYWERMQQMVTLNSVIDHTLFHPLYSTIDRSSD